MATQNTLLQLIQFVGLITPAVAILIELTVQFHGGLEKLKSDKRLPFELQILFLGTAAILLGGMTIGGQMILTLNDTGTQAGALLIFGALPFIGISILAMNIRISGTSDSSSVSLLESTVSSGRYIASILTPVAFMSLITFGVVYWQLSNINSLFDWWIFRDVGETVWYFYVISGLLVYKVTYSLWTHDKIPTQRYELVLKPTFVIGFTALTFFVLFTAPAFFGYWLLVELGLPHLTEDAIFSAIPYIWGALIILLEIVVEMDPDSD